MSDQEEQTGQSASETADNSKSELELLKQRARMMGITFSNNIGIDSLKAKIAEKMGTSSSESEDKPGEPKEPVQEQEATPQAPNALELGAQATLASMSADPAALSAATLADTTVIAAQETLPEQPKPEAPKKPETLRQKLYRENMRLVRCRITNLDPKKKDLPGEILVVANEFLGSVKKFIPYGEATEDGYHIPFVLYEHLRTKRFLHIRTVRDRRTGTNSVKSTYEREFAIEVLEPLTEHELQRLATAQIAAGSTSDD